ncbi:hypothetical protein EV138_6384 [Kribbella voronezhensis]|uniref:Uncharacterized protein n=1 Tax=Kribbella voronezhensis TaxID=2512212 RepID=A0A4R7SX28_9ACTN|nr:hypothetical protein [Kribbella voronezhensis]TDU83920.1 hypothetical protein EV138_6384 [Kribbella voronezhensis]
MSFVRASLRAAHRTLTDDNFDLWLLTGAAGVFTVLGIVNVASMSVLSSAILALLAALSISQIRSRRLVAQIADRAGPADVLLHNFPEDLIRRRADADDLLLIGIAMARTIQGARDDLHRALTRGARIRVLIVDPTDQKLVEQAALLRPTGRAALLSQRIRTTLDELVELKASTQGNLAIRVAQFIPPIGVSLINARGSATVTIQHPELRPAAEPGPILHFAEADGAWFTFYARQAERLWEAGTAWPPPPGRRLNALARPQFTQSFGAELLTSMKAAKELLITGVARNTLLVENYTEFERWLRQGCAIRILLIDPRSNAVETAAQRYYAERSLESAKARIDQALRLLSELAASTGGTLEVRLTSHPIPLGLVAVDAAAGRHTDYSALFIEYYTFQAPGEPKFVLQPADTWFPQFLAEAELLWSSARPAHFGDRPQG